MKKKKKMRNPPAARGDAVPPQDSKDYWTMTSDVLVRNHEDERTELFSPEGMDLPVPIKCLDVTRRTETDSDHLADKSVEDYWVNNGTKRLSQTWRGRTVFRIRRPKPTIGYQWGRRTPYQNSNHYETG